MQYYGEIFLTGKTGKTVFMESSEKEWGTGIF